MIEKLDRERDYVRSWAMSTLQCVEMNRELFVCYLSLPSVTPLLYLEYS